MSEKSINVSILVDDEHLAHLDEVLGTLRSAGLEVSRVLRDVGSITGVVPADRLPAVRAVAGVSHVEENRNIRIPPPDAPVQ